MASSNEKIRSMNELLDENDLLREKNEYYKNIIESANKGVWVISDEGKTVYINYRMAAMLGYTIDEVMGETIFEFIDEDYRSIFTSRLAGCKAECYEQFDLKFRRKDWNELWALAGLRPLFDGSGINIGVNCTFVDITDRKLMEMALRETRDNLEKAQRIGKMGSWVLDYKTDKIEFSEELSNILGVQKTLMSMEDIFGLIYDGDKEVFRRKVLSDLENKGSFKSDVRVVRGDGRIIHCYVEANVTRDMDGRRDKVVGVLQDITERKLAEEALLESEEKFRYLAEMSPVAILFHSGESFIYANPAALRIFDRSFDEMSKMKFWDLFDPECRDLVKERGLARLRGENPPQRYEVKLRTKEGEKWMDITSSRVKYKGKTTILTIGMDVTQNKHTEMALREAKANAEFFIDLIIHDFGNLSHEILGYLELAQDSLSIEGDDTELIAKPMEIINKSSRLIKDVRMLRQIRSGAFEIKRVDAGELLARAVADNTAANHARINCPPPGHFFVMANESLGGAFSDIISNMIESGGKGKVIDIKVESIEENGRPYYKITFEDNGPGMPDKLKAQMMSNTWEQNGKTVRKNLGPRFVKAIIEAYRGKLRIEDRVAGDYKKGIRIIVMLLAEI